MKRLLFLAFVSLPVPLLADGGLPNQPYIYVEGKAEVEKPADMVTLRFDVVARNADQAKANSEVQGKAGKILGMANDRKIAQSDVIAADLKSEPQYEGDEDSSRKRGKLIGYSVRRSFVITVRDVGGFAKMVDELLGIPGLEFSAISGGLSKEKETEEDVWEKALASGREHADKTAKLLGMQIDSVFAASPVAIPEISQRIFSSSASFATTERVIIPDPLQYRLAPVTVSQRVHVIYLISPAK